MAELATLKNKLSIREFEHIVRNGKGEMPAFASINTNEIKNLYNYLTTATGSVGNRSGGPAEPFKMSGPVVDSGGAPGGLCNAW